MSQQSFITIRVDEPGDDGHQVVTLILGGTHRGGVSDWHRECYGDMPLEAWQDLSGTVTTWLGEFLSRTHKWAQMSLSEA